MKWLGIYWSEFTQMFLGLRRRKTVVDTHSLRIKLTMDGLKYVDVDSDLMLFLYKYDGQEYTDDGWVTVLDTQVMTDGPRMQLLVKPEPRDKV